MQQKFSYRLPGSSSQLRLKSLSQAVFQTDRLASGMKQYACRNCILTRLAHVVRPFTDCVSNQTIRKCKYVVRPFTLFVNSNKPSKGLECVSKRKTRKFEWIFRQFKEEIRRLSSAKSRIDDAEMAQKTPILRIKEFLRHTLALTLRALQRRNCEMPPKLRTQNLFCHTLKSRGKESSYFLCRGLFKLRML